MSTKKSHIRPQDLKKIAARLRLLRKHVAPNQAEFAKSLGISANFVSDLERGRTGPSMTLLMLIESRYAVSPHQILTGEGFSTENIGKPRPIYGPSKQTQDPIAELNAAYNSELSTLFPLTTFGDAVDKLRFIYESKNHTLTAAILANLTAFEFSIKLINELSDIKNRLSRVESVLEEHKPPKETGERRKAWLQIRNK